MSWFFTRPVTRDCWLVCEPSQVNSFLVAGSERAVAIDTGLGIAPIAPVHAQLTDLPVEVVNTHYHADHVGGNHEYTEIAIQADGAEAITNQVPEQLLREYMAFSHRLIAAGSASARSTSSTSICSTTTARPATILPASTRAHGRSSRPRHPDPGRRRPYRPRWARPDGDSHPGHLAGQHLPAGRAQRAAVRR